MSEPALHPLIVKRQFAAARERVFRAWIDSRYLSRWFRPAPDYEVILTECDPRVGGHYRLGMRATEPGSPDRIVGGIYEEIIAPERLVFTWRWEGEHSEEPEMRITLEFREHGGGTELVLTQQPFVRQATRDSHLHGWEGCLASLEALLSSSTTL